MMKSSLKLSVRAWYVLMWAIFVLTFVLGYIAGCTKAHTLRTSGENVRGATSSIPAPFRSCLPRAACDAREGVALSLPAKEFAGFGLVAKPGGGLGAAAGKPAKPFPSACNSAGRNLAPTAQRAEVSMKEHSAGDSRRRISAALYTHGAVAGSHPAAAPLISSAPSASSACGHHHHDAS